MDHLFGKRILIGCGAIDSPLLRAGTIVGSGTVYHEEQLEAVYMVKLDEGFWDESSTVYVRIFPVRPTGIRKIL